MRLGSLFSGIGGFDLAFERVGAECAWQVEVDDNCRSVLARHWPDVTRYRDVRHVHDQRGAHCPHCLPAVDVLAGGFPCQDVSVAGRRAGLAGERSGLWFEFRRLAAQLRPRWVVIENVPGLLSSNGGRDFGVIVRGLVKLGYGVAWRVLDAQYFGVLQGFPDGWTEGESDSARYRMLGNAVPVPVVEWIARRLLAQEVAP